MNYVFFKSIDIALTKYLDINYFVSIFIIKTPTIVSEEASGVTIRSYQCRHSPVTSAPHWGMILKKN